MYKICHMSIVINVLKTSHMNHNPTTTFPMINFPSTGILCSVDVEDKSFRLGKFKLKFPTLVDNLKEHILFLENLLVLELIDEYMPVEYQEKVTITYQDGPLIYNEGYKHPNDLMLLKGLMFTTDRGVLLEMGIQSTIYSDELSYIFKYYPKNLKSNNVDWYDLNKSVNEVW